MNSGLEEPHVIFWNLYQYQTTAYWIFSSWNDDI